MIWTATHEGGNLNEWTEDARGGSYPEPAVAGTDGTAEISGDFARSGALSLKLTRPAVGTETGPGAYRDLRGRNRAHYASWFLVPEQQRPASRWTIMKFRLRDPSSADPPAEGLDLDLRSLPGGGYVLSVFDHDSSYLQEPIAVPPPVVEVGRWFHVEVLYRSAGSAGAVAVWLDGRKVYDLMPHPTTADGAYFTPCNIGLDLGPSPVSVYVDDASISLTRVTPSGLLRR